MTSVEKCVIIVSDVGLWLIFGQSTVKVKDMGRENGMLEVLNSFCKRFREFELTWKRLGIFTGAMGVLTAICALVMPKMCSLYSISQSAELWIVLVLLIAMKCSKEVDAALMSGGMLFCSHFLAAMIKTPFNRAAPEEFIGWVPVIVCSVPYAYFACRFFKEEDGKGRVWLLSVTAAVMVLYGFVHLKGFVGRPVYQTAAVLFCFGAAAVMVKALIADRETRLISSVSCGVAVLIGAVCAFAHTYRYNCVVLLDDAKYPLTDSWSVTAEDTGISDPAISEGADDTAVLEVTFYEEGENTYTLTSPDGEEYEIVVNYDGDKGVNVYDKK